MWGQMMGEAYQLVSVATFDSHEACIEAEAGFKLMRSDKGIRQFFFSSGPGSPQWANCVPIGSEAAIKGYIATHPEEAEKAPPKDKPPIPPR